VVRKHGWQIPAGTRMAVRSNGPSGLNALLHPPLSPHIILCRLTLGPGTMYMKDHGLPAGDRPPVGIRNLYSIYKKKPSSPFTLRVNGRRAETTISGPRPERRSQRSKLGEIRA